jgi:carbon monoxide dehydrogenase subunit G
MEFTHEFHVPSDVDTTFAMLIDLEKVAPCLPGRRKRSTVTPTPGG